MFSKLFLPVLLFFIKTFRDEGMQKSWIELKLFLKNYALLQIFFHEALFMAILGYLFQKWHFLMYSRVSHPNVFYSGSSQSLYKPWPGEKIYYFYTYVCLQVPHKCLISNGMFFSQSAPKVLLDLNTQTIFVMELEKMYIIRVFPKQVV